MAYGLDRHDPADGNGDLNDDGYTNLEEYLNGRDPTEPPAIVGAAAVPDGAFVPGFALTVSKTDVDRITLDWGASCLATEVDFEIYEGELGRFPSHAIQFCSTGGATTKTYRPANENAYVLVVPRDATREGSYGRDGDGAERAPAPEACLPRIRLDCP